MLLAMAAFLGAIGTVKFRQIQAGAAMAASFQPPPEAVTTVVARQDQWPATVSAIGSVAAVRGVTVSADLPGIVEAISFDSGRQVQAGEVLVRLDAQAGARAAGRRGSAARSRARHPRPRPGPGRRRRGLPVRARPGQRRAQAGGSAGGRAPRHHRPQADPRALLGRARHPAGQPRPVPQRRRPRRVPAGRRSRVRELLGAPAGRRGAARSGRRCRSRAKGSRAPSRPAGSPPSTPS